MPPIGRTIIDGLIISIGLGFLIMVSLYVSPRIWLQDYPAQIRAALPPLNAAEKRQRAIFGVLFFGSIISALLVSTWNLRTANGGQLGFVPAFVHLYLLFTIFNLWDTVVIDWLLISVLRPRWAFPPGVESMMHLLPTVGDHWKAFVKGLLIGVVFCLPLAWIASL